MAEFSTGSAARMSRPGIVGGDSLEFDYHPLELVDNAALSCRFENFEDSLEIRDLQVAATLKTAPDFRPDHAIVFQDRSRVIQLVGDRDQAHIRRLAAQTVDRKSTRLN